MRARVLCLLVVCVSLVDCLQFPGKLTVPAPEALKESKIPILNWIVQKLDHFNVSEDRTWSQRYYVNEEFYSPGGPMFLMVNMEGPADADWLRGGQMVEYALFYNAKLFLLEPRFYGESRPTEDTSVENLQYLTTDQTLADLSYLVQAIGVSHPGAKVILFGGWFSGNLATWARLKYPDIVHAAVAASAPLLARFNFLEYMEEVGRVMALASQDCYDDMATAVADVTAIFGEPDGAQTIAQLFSLCTELDSNNPMDMMSFMTTFSNIFANVVQSATSIEDVQNECEFMTNPVYGALPLDRLVELFRREFHPEPDTCFEISYQPYMEVYQNTSWESPGNTLGLRQYNYQTCSQFADFETSVSLNQPFGDAFPINQFVQMCLDFYGDSYNFESIQASVRRTNSNFGGLQPGVTNVVFTQGSFDPWRLLGVQSDLSASATAIVIEGSSHMTFLYATNATDSAQLTAARIQVRDLIGTWL